MAVLQANMRPINAQASHQSNRPADPNKAAPMITNPANSLTAYRKMTRDFIPLFTDASPTSVAFLNRAPTDPCD